MGYTLDVMVILVLLICCIVGARRGFVKSLLGLGAAVLSFFVSFKLKDRVGELLSDKFLYEFFYKRVNTYVQGVADEVNATGETLKNALNKGILRYIKIGDTTVLSSDSVEDVSKSISESLTGSFASVLAFVAIFVVSLILITLILRVIDKICDLPILSGINGLLGLVIGLAKGVILCFVLSTIFEVLYPYLHLDTLVQYEEMIDKTLIYHYISALNPLSVI